MIHLAILLLSTAGFAALALSTRRAQENVSGRRWERSPSLRTRLIGWAGLAAALAVAIGGYGWAYGLVTYVGFLSLTAGLVFGSLVVAERRRAAKFPSSARR